MCLILICGYGKFIEGEPAIIEDLIGKNYTQTPGGYTYTMKKSTVNGISFMNLHQYGENVEDGKADEYIVIIENTVYKITKGQMKIFGTINLDKASSDYGTITQTDDKDGSQYIYAPNN